MVVQCNPRYLFALGLFCRHGAKHLDSGELSSPSVGDITDTLKLHFKSETPLIKMKALQVRMCSFKAHASCVQVREM